MTLPSRVHSARLAAAASCESLTSFALPDGRITSAVLAGAGAFEPPMGGLGGFAAFNAAPAFCRVTRTLTPTPDSNIKIEIWMPAENWNGKLVGIGHCGGGDVPNATDMIFVIDQWAEKGKTPDSIIASNPPDQKQMSRPICPYPHIAKYKGSGRTDDAANFECKAKWSIESAESIGFHNNSTNLSGIIVLV
jgi:Tannase and feruloyl esterase